MYSINNIYFALIIALTYLTVPGFIILKILRFKVDLVKVVSLSIVYLTVLSLLLNYIHYLDMFGELDVNVVMSAGQHCVGSGANQDVLGVLMCRDDKTQGNLILDSGGTSHMSNDRDCFDNYIIQREK